MKVRIKNQKVCFYLAALFLVPLFLFFNTSCAKTAKKTNEIIIWHWMTDRQEAFEELAKKYKETKGIEARFELFAPSEIYSSKVRASAQTKTLPDIFGVLGESRNFAAFIKAGFITDLTGYMKANNGSWYNSFHAKALLNNEFKADNEYGIKPGVYGVPIDVTNIQILYNKKLFQKAGLDPENPPQAWDEFLETGKKLREAGIQVLVSGFGETWLLDCLASNFAWNLMGSEKIIATIKGEVPYTDPDWIFVLSLFQKMYEEEIFATGSVTMVNKVAERNFANERSAMAFNGSWCVNVYHSMNPGLSYGVLMPPKISDNFPRAIWGGAGSSFMVNPNSPLKEEAIEFLKWITEVPQQVFLAEETRNLPSNKDCVEKINPILSQFADDMDLVVHPSQLPVSEFPTVIEAFDKGIQSIIIGEKTPEQVADHVQGVKKREQERARR